jgi:hypothetical protein
MKVKTLKSKLKANFFKEIIRSWWVVLFILFCAIWYERSIRPIIENKNELTQKLFELQKEKLSLQQLKEELELRINSQNDLEWIELTLMKNLGLVPEGQYKIYIEKSKTPQN